MPPKRGVTTHRVLAASGVRVDLGRVEVARNSAEVDQARAAGARAPVVLVYLRTNDLIDEMLALCAQQIDLAESTEEDGVAVDSAKERRQALGQRLESISERLGAILQEPDQEANLIEPGDRAITRRVMNYFCDRHPSGWVGRQLHALARRAGLVPQTEGALSN